MNDSMECESPKGKKRPDPPERDNDDGPKRMDATPNKKRKQTHLSSFFSAKDDSSPPPNARKKLEPSGRVLPTNNNENKRQRKEENGHLESIQEEEEEEEKSNKASNKRDDEKEKRKKNNKSNEKEDKNNKEKKKTSSSPVAASKTTASSASANNDAIIPIQVPTSQQTIHSRGIWKVVNDCMLVRHPRQPKTNGDKSNNKNNKVAAFDLDGTLLIWTCSGWPSQLTHYELWNTSVFDKLRHLYDEEGYDLVLFSNQGSIRSAFTGKTATRVKTLMDWLAWKINRPLHCIASTSRKMGHHKPNVGMWTTAQKEFKNINWTNVEDSFYVGDSVLNDEDPQGGVDEQFALNVGNQVYKGRKLTFYDPQQYFGRSNRECRQVQKSIRDDYEVPPNTALQARAALLGGYIKGPIMLLVCGVQGSGKSTFCRRLVEKEEKENEQEEDKEKDDDKDKEEENEKHVDWIHLSQDTIRNGKPGKRQDVEAATRRAIVNDKVSVVVDRMHLNAEQRRPFIELAKELGVQVHVIMFCPPTSVVTQRVRERTNHPGGVEGEKGVALALRSLQALVMPRYSEGISLISCTKMTSHDGIIESLCRHYRAISLSPSKQNMNIPDSCSLAVTDSNNNNTTRIVTMPLLGLGTMGIGKKKAPEVVSLALDLGWNAIDTAPTYKNETQVGEALDEKSKANNDEKAPFVICKIPKAVSQANQVRPALESTLQQLQKKSCSLLLLHWPCDVIEADTLMAVWKEMEQCCREGLCDALGVCNFNVGALQELLCHCQIPPVVNQVERHPLFPQWRLVDFCMQNDVLLQAHTPLGQGKLVRDDDADIVSSTLKQIGQECGGNQTSPARILWEWNLRQGIAVVSKCSTREHLEEAMTTLQTPSLEPAHFKTLDKVRERKRFVAPPFMYKSGAIYSWGDRRPANKKTPKKK